MLRQAATDILLITGAAGSAQVLTFLAAPLITRIYDPQSFGRFALFSAAVTILYPLASLRYEWALPLTADEKSARDLLALCAAVIAGFSAVTVVAIVLASPILSGWTALTRAELMLLPAGIAAFSLNGVATNWLTRQHAFSRLAGVRFTTVVGTLTGQIVCGALLRLDAKGLILGFIVGSLSGVAVGFRWSQLLQIAADLRFARVSGLRRVAAEYRSFAIITAPSNILNAIGSQLPSIVFPVLYGLAVTGQYSLAQRVLAQPMSLVGQAVNQVFWGNAARLFTHEPARLWLLFLRINAGLLIAMVPGFLFMRFGPQLFSIVFGPAWRQAGVFAELLIIGVIVGLPAQGTTSLHIYRLNHWMGAWELLQLALISGALAFAVQASFQPAACVIVITAAVAVANAVLLGLNAVAIRRAMRRYEALACRAPDRDL